MPAPSSHDTPRKFRDDAFTADTDGRRPFADDFVNADLIATDLNTLGLVQMAETADPGDGEALPVTGSADIPIVTAGAETNTLPDPTRVGLVLHLWMQTDGGDRVVTAPSPVNTTGNNTLTFGDAGDSIILMSVRDGASAYKWRVLVNDGVGLTTV